MSRVFVVGASTGGVRALQKLCTSLPAGFPAPILVVQHVGANHSVLPEILSWRGDVTAVHPTHGERIEAGRVYIAPPDQHMLLAGDTIRLFRGPKEHHTRPAIDPLFRCSALSRGADVVGVVLTGELDDGTAGLQAIKARGGIAVVQEPADALAPSMPSSAVQHVAVDHVLPLADLPELFKALAAREAAPTMTPPHSERLEHEQALAEGHGDALEHLRKLGSPSTFACPDCHGSLWRIDGSAPVRYRCHTGHGYTRRSLQENMAEATDAAMWNALRAVQEEMLLLRSSAADAQTSSATQGEIEQAAQSLRAWNDAAGVTMPAGCKARTGEQCSYV